MKTIFAKYNSERLPKYQIVTKIVVGGNGQKYAIKEALCDEAKAHIEDIYNNYELLKNSHNLNLVKPIKIENGVMFEMAKGMSLENILLEAAVQNDKERFTKYINKFLDLLDMMVTKRNTVFKPSQEFKAIFGEWESNAPQDIIKVANIDLIFGNVFVDENDDFSLIDYEWVFDFEVPKNYILWRNIEVFSAYHSIYLSKYMINIDAIENKIFKQLDDMFVNFVYGKYKKYFLDPKVSKKVSFINLDKKETIVNHDHFIQLFISQDTYFTEENSIKHTVIQTTELQNFEFNVKDFGDIKNLRIDLLNDSCVVEIEKIILINHIYEIELQHNEINSNAVKVETNKYYFDNDDPQLYFYKLTSDEYATAKELRIYLKYLYTGKEASNECYKNTKEDLENTKEDLKNTKEDLENTKEDLENIKNSLSWKITKPLRIFRKLLKNNRDR